MKLKIKDGRAKVQAAKFETGEDLAKAIEAAIKKHFPKSTVKVSVQKSLGPGKSIYLFFAVAGSQNEVTNHIWQNDISLTKAFVYGVEESGKLKDTLEFEPAQGGSILSKPDPGTHYAYSHIKVGLRKKKGTPEQILKHIDSYFAKLAKAIKDNKDKIPEDHLKLLKSI
jgi:hypothetical protein